MGQAKSRRKALGCSYGQRLAMAWHYTLGRKIPLIIEDGFLRDDWTQRNKHLFPHHIYSVWFTLSERVDPTSTAGLTEKRSYSCDPALFKQITGGHWRIGLPSGDERLITYKQALDRFKPSSAFGRFFRGLPHHGENRNQWMLVQEQIPLADLAFQELASDSWSTRDPLNQIYDYGFPSLSAVCEGGVHLLRSGYN